MKQTALNFLIEKLDNNLDIKHSWRTKQYIEQAKEMEKQQIIEFADKYDTYIVQGGTLTAERYYNKTFQPE